MRKKKNGSGIWQRGNCWYIEITVKGQRYRECLGRVSKTFAKELAAKRRTEIIERQLRPKAQDPLFEKFFQEYMDTISANKGSHTREKVAYAHLLPFFRGRRLSQITQLMIERYKKQRKDEIQAKKGPDANLASVNRELALLSHMFTKAIKDGKAQFNPVKGIQRFQEVERNQILDEGLEEEELYKAIRSCHKTSHIEPIIRVLLGTACRVGEVLNMKKEWIDSSLKLAKIPRTSTKNKKPKVVRFTDEVWSIIEESAEASKGDYIFSKNDGTPYKRINKAWETVRKTIGRPDLRIHDLKGTVLTRLGNRGYDTFMLKEVSGNVEIGTLGRYVRYRDRDVREALN
ncbi:MAG: tyrosine-type recombinase/integrase, partial [Candidatus Aenigmarchaeota archaeon]|nr:tyrosine-type recombinase/integrase [Candidatus Aenigmarchaeota archaeon]